MAQTRPLCNTWLRFGRRARGGCGTVEHVVLSYPGTHSMMNALDQLAISFGQQRERKRPLAWAFRVA